MGALTCGDSGRWQTGTDLTLIGTFFYYLQMCFCWHVTFACAKFLGRVHMSSQSCKQIAQHEHCQFSGHPRQASAEGATESEESAMDDFLNSLFLAGQRRDYIHNGSELQGVGSLRIQLEGNRVLVMALYSDIKTYLVAQNPDEAAEANIVSNLFDCCFGLFSGES